MRMRKIATAHPKHKVHKPKAVTHEAANRRITAAKRVSKHILSLPEEDREPTMDIVRNMHRRKQSWE